MSREETTIQIEMQQNEQRRADDVRLIDQAQANLLRAEAERERIDFNFDGDDASRDDQVTDYRADLRQADRIVSECRATMLDLQANFIEKYGSRALSEYF